MIHAYDHFLAFLLAIALPIESYFGYRKFVARVRAGVPGVRLRQFRMTALVQWALVGGVVAAWIASKRSLSALGFQFPLDWRAILVTVLCVAVAYLYHAQLAALTASKGALERLAPSIEPVADLLPTTERERKWFYFLSFTAGICEEWLYRGFFVWYLVNAMPLYLAVAITSALFGLCHAYQGRKGIVKTGVVGLVFSLLYVFGRTIYPVMLLHAAIDVVGGAMGYEYVRRRRNGGQPVPAAQPSPV